MCKASAGTQRVGRSGAWSFRPAWLQDSAEGTGIATKLGSFSTLHVAFPLKPLPLLSFISRSFAFPLFSFLPLSLLFISSFLPLTSLSSFLCSFLPSCGRESLITHYYAVFPVSVMKSTKRIEEENKVHAPTSQILTQHSVSTRVGNGACPTQVLWTSQNNIGANNSLSTHAAALHPQPHMKCFCVGKV